MPDHSDSASTFDWHINPSTLLLSLGFSLHIYLACRGMASAVTDMCISAALLVRHSSAPYQKDFHEVIIVQTDTVLDVCDLCKLNSILTDE